MFKWELGRQNDSGYSKLTLLRLTWPFKMDMYILKYPQNSYIQWHKDEVAFGKHYRANLVLRKSIGGNFLTKQFAPKYEGKRFVLFRPDVIEHCVTHVVKGTRYVLSIGWIA